MITGDCISATHTHAHAHMHTPACPLSGSESGGKETVDYRFVLQHWANLKSPNELSLIIEITEH